MSRRARQTLARLPIKAVYTMGELAHASSIERRKLRRLLERQGVELLISGRIAYVPLSELEVKVRPLWEGIKAAHALRGFARD